MEASIEAHIYSRYIAKCISRYANRWCLQPPFQELLENALYTQQSCTLVIGWYYFLFWYFGNYLIPKVKGHQSFVTASKCSCHWRGPSPYGSALWPLRPGRRQSWEDPVLERCMLMCLLFEYFTHGTITWCNIMVYTLNRNGSISKWIALKIFNKPLYSSMDLE